MDNLEIVYVNVNELNPAPYNPRKWSDKAIKNLTKSIKEHGFCDPLIANCAPNRKNVLIGGHFRLKIAKNLIYKTVPVVYLNIPDLEEEKALNLRLNKSNGDWNFELLKNFDLTLLKDVGFDSKELSSAWDGLLEVKT